MLCGWRCQCVLCRLSGSSMITRVWTPAGFWTGSWSRTWTGHIYASTSPATTGWAGPRATACSSGTCWAVWTPWTCPNVRLLHLRVLNHGETLWNDVVSSESYQVQWISVFVVLFLQIINMSWVCSRLMWKEVGRTLMFSSIFLVKMEIQVTRMEAVPFKP